MARQGYSYTTADGVRLVYQTEGEVLKDVPQDGKTVGEIVVRGNLVMREVGASQKLTPPFSLKFNISFGSCSILQTSRPPRRLSGAIISTVATWPSCTQMVR